MLSTATSSQDSLHRAIAAMQTKQADTRSAVAPLPVDQPARRKWTKANSIDSIAFGKADTYVSSNGTVYALSAKRHAGQIEPYPDENDEFVLHDKLEEIGQTDFAKRNRIYSIKSIVSDFLNKRVQWTSKMEYLLSVIGFVIDLSNVWRFPYVCYRNGGGAFLIPYMIMFFLGGLPLFYMELALGQYHRTGCISLWTKVCPIFKGIGFAIVIINSYVAFFYNTVLSWAVYYCFSAMRAEVPWASCNNTWNTPACLETQFARERMLEIKAMNATNTTNITWVSPAEEFFMNEVLEIGRSDGLENLGQIKWSLALCLFLIFIIVYFSLWKGPRSSGKAVWITATLPYIVLMILLVRGVTLPGAGDGISYYLTPQFDKLKETRVWIDAATQIFFSLGPGFGVLLALSSYNDFNNNCYGDAIKTSIINCLTSFMSGFVIFSVLGYMSHTLGRDIKEVAGDGGPGLIFIVYPQAIATMRFSPFWAIIFFIMLITLGLDSTYGGLESIITGICDEFPKVGRHRELFVLALVVYCYLGSLPTTTYGGNYMIEFFDHYGVSITIVLVVCIESFAIFHFYGVNRFSNDIVQMLGFRPGIGWRFCWKAISPTFILAMFICACVGYTPLSYPNYTYPWWSVPIGWVVRMSSIGCIPAYAIYLVAFKLEGSFLERLKLAISPAEEEDLDRKSGIDNSPVRDNGSPNWPANKPSIPQTRSLNIIPMRHADSDDVNLTENPIDSFVPHYGGVGGSAAVSPASIKQSAVSTFMHL